MVWGNVRAPHGADIKHPALNRRHKLVSHQRWSPERPGWDAVVVLRHSKGLTTPVVMTRFPYRCTRGKRHPPWSLTVAHSGSSPQVHLQRDISGNPQGFKSFNIPLIWVQLIEQKSHYWIRKTLLEKKKKSVDILLSMTASWILSMKPTNWVGEAVVEFNLHWERAWLCDKNANAALN